MGCDRQGKTLAVFIVAMFVIGLAGGLIAFALALNFYPGPAVGLLTVNSSQVTGNAMSSSIVVNLTNAGNRTLVLSYVAVQGVNYTLNPGALGVPQISGCWAFVVEGVNGTSLGIGKTGTLYLNSSGRIDTTQVSLVSVVCLDGTSLAFNVTRIPLGYS